MSRLTRLAWIGIGLTGLVLPAIPLRFWVADPDSLGPVMGPQVQSWAIGLSVVLVVGLLAGRFAATARRPAVAMPDISHRQLVAGLAILVALAAAAVMRAVFAANPHLVDEIAQLFHARVLASGRLAAPAPDPPDPFLITHTGISAAGWVSQYPPGQTVLLALGLLLRAEWLVNPLLGGLSVVLIYYAARGLYGRRTAIVAAILWAMSAWVMFMSGSYMNHVGAVTFALLAWALTWGVRRATRVTMLAAGAALAAAAATRPLDGLAAGLPVLAWILLLRRWKHVPWMTLGGVPVMLAWFWFNWRIYGNPLELGYTALYGESHGLGFHTDPWGVPYTPAAGLGNMSVAIRRLHIYLFEWPIPALLPFLAWALLDRQRRDRDLVLAIGVVAAPVLYFFYWHSGFYLGPRFYYLAAPLIVIAMARGWVRARLAARRARRDWIRWDAALAGAALAVVVWGWLDVLPRRLEVYRAGLATAKLHPERELEARGVEQALVVVPESFGSRTMVALWGMGVSPTMAERAYRRLDTCELYLVARRAQAGQWTVPLVTRHLDSLMAVRPPAAKVNGWPDPTLRLYEGQPADVCQPELRRDLIGFSIYGYFAWRNAPALDRGIVFARDLFERNPEYLSRYAGWELWRLAPPSGQPGVVAVLTRIGRVEPAAGAGSGQ